MGQGEGWSALCVCVFWTQFSTSLWKIENWNFFWLSCVCSLVPCPMLKVKLKKNLILSSRRMQNTVFQKLFPLMKGAEYLVPAKVVLAYTKSVWHTEGVFYFCFDWINNVSLNSKVRCLKFNVTVSLIWNTVELSLNYILLWMWFWFLSFRN